MIYDLKITIYIGGLTGGGAERVCCNLANSLVEKGHEVTILTVSTSQNTSYAVNENVKLESLETTKRIKNNTLRMLVKQLNLISFIRKKSTDVYIVMLPRTIRSLMFFRRFINAPIIFSERANPESYDKKTQKVLKKAANFADGIVFQTELAQKWYLPYIKNRSVIIPNAINPEFIRPIYGGEREKIIVSVGRLTEQKNFKLLLDAFCDVYSEFTEYKLRIYGKGPLENELRTYAESLGINDRVQFMGYVSNIPEELEKSSIFVLSSDFEGMPNALLEAMAVSLPCISTDCPAGGSAFLIDNGKNGLLVPMKDKTKMVEAMRILLSDENYAMNLGKNARDIITK